MAIADTLDLIFIRDPGKRISRRINRNIEFLKKNKITPREWKWEKKDLEKEREVDEELIAELLEVYNNNKIFFTDNLLEYIERLKELKDILNDILKCKDYNLGQKKVYDFLGKLNSVIDELNSDIRIDNTDLRKRVDHILKYEPQMQGEDLKTLMKRKRIAFLAYHYNEFLLLERAMQKSNKSDRLIYFLNPDLLIESNWNRFIKAIDYLMKNNTRVLDELWSIQLNTSRILRLPYLIKFLQQHQFHNIQDFLCKEYPIEFLEWLTNHPLEKTDLNTLAYIYKEPQLKASFDKAYEKGMYSVLSLVMDGRLKVENLLRLPDLQGFEETFSDEFTKKLRNEELEILIFEIIPGFAIKGNIIDDLVAFRIINKSMLTINKDYKTIIAAISQIRSRKAYDYAKALYARFSSIGQFFMYCRDLDKKSWKLLYLSSNYGIKLDLDLPFQKNPLFDKREIWALYYKINRKLRHYDNECSINDIFENIQVQSSDELLDLMRLFKKNIWFLVFYLENHTRSNVREQVDKIIFNDAFLKRKAQVTDLNHAKDFIEEIKAIKNDKRYKSVEGLDELDYQVVHATNAFDGGFAGKNYLDPYEKIIHDIAKDATKQSLSEIQEGLAQLGITLKQELLTSRYSPSCSVISTFGYYGLTDGNAENKEKFGNMFGIILCSGKIYAAYPSDAGTIVNEKRPQFRKPMGSHFIKPVNLGLMLNFGVPLGRVALGHICNEVLPAHWSADEIFYETGVKNEVKEKLIAIARILSGKQYKIGSRKTSLTIRVIEISENNVKRVVWPEDSEQYKRYLTYDQYKKRQVLLKDSQIGASRYASIVGTLVVNKGKVLLLQKGLWDISHDIWRKSRTHDLTINYAIEFLRRDMPLPQGKLDVYPLRFTLNDYKHIQNAECIIFVLEAQETKSGTWFDPDALPSDIDPLARAAIEKLRRKPKS